MIDPVHVVCICDDLRILDARLADLAQAATLARLPAIPMEDKAKERLRIASNRKDPVSAAVRTCPDTGARLTIALWEKTATGVAGGVELELVDPSRHDVLVLSEPLRLDGPKPDLSDGDGPWLDRIRDIVSHHRDRMAIPEPHRGETPFVRVARLAHVAARSAHRGGVDAGLRRDGKTDGPASGTTIALSPPSPYGPGTMRAATKGPMRIEHDVQPADAIRSDLATLVPVVAVAITRSGQLDRISLHAYGTLHNPISPEDRDAMQRLRDAAEFAVDRIDLALPRHVTTLGHDMVGRLAISTDGDVSRQERDNAADAFRIGAEAASRSQIDPVGPGSVIFKDTVSGATFMRRRSVGASECSVEWIVSNGPKPNTEISLSVSLAGSDAAAPKGTVTPDAIAAELSHLAEGMASSKDGTVPHADDMQAFIAATRIASIVDTARDHDRTLVPFDIHVGIDPFGNLDAHVIPVFQSTAIPVCDDPQDLGHWTGHDAGRGYLKRLGGAGLRLELRPCFARVRYVPDDPDRTDVMERLRVETERLAGLLPPLSNRLLAKIA